MATKFRIATEQERAEYKAAGGLYPLHGYLTFECGTVCPVEDLRRYWDRGNPQWEVLAPKGKFFAGSMTHTMLEHTLGEAKALAKSATLEDCLPDCGCGCAIDMGKAPPL